MRYEMIKKYKLSHKIIAKAMGYKTLNGFRCSSAHQRIMSGVNEILRIVDQTSKE